MGDKISAAEAAKMSGAEVAGMAAALPADKFESLLRYMRILVRLKEPGSNPEAEALNNSLQARIEAGELTIPEAGEIMAQIEAALDRAAEE